MPQRIFYGTLAIAVMLGIVWGDAAIARWFEGRAGAWSGLLACGSLIPVASALLCLIGATELVRVLRSQGARPAAVLAYAVVVLLILSPWLGAGYACGRGPGSRALYATVFSVGLGVLATCASLVGRARCDGALRDAGATVLTFLYVGLLPSFAVQIRSGVAGPGPAGAWLLFAWLVIIKASDIGAYFTGTFFGRHKLIPSISPGKSVEGALGGMVLSGLVAMAAVRLASGWFSESGASAVPNIVIKWSDNLIPVFFSGVAMSLVAQIGDLVESCFKRDGGVKDSGRVLPRFGGVLDIIDSPLLALPVAWMILTLTA